MSAAPPLPVAPPPLVYPPSEDEKSLRLLSIFHFVLGGLNCFGACFGLFYVGLGAFFLNAPESNQHPRHSDLTWIFIGIVAFIFLFAGAMALCTIMAGLKLSRRKGYRFAFVIACLECISFPMGTILGVFTLVALSKPSVKNLFAVPSPVSPSGTPPPPIG